MDAYQKRNAEGRCARHACDNPHQNCKHVTHPHYLYCVPCARRINEANLEYGTLVQLPTIEEREEMKAKPASKHRTYDRGNSQRGQVARAAVALSLAHLMSGSIALPSTEAATESPYVPPSDDGALARIKKSYPQNFK